MWVQIRSAIQTCNGLPDVLNRPAHIQSNGSGPAVRVSNCSIIMGSYGSLWENRNMYQARAIISIRCNCNIIYLYIGMISEPQTAKRCATFTSCIPRTKRPTSMISIVSKMHKTSTGATISSLKVHVTPTTSLALASNLLVLKLSAVQSPRELTFRFSLTSRSNHN